MAKPGSELVGRTFLHKHWLDPVAMPDKVPAEFQVTAVRNGQVYIRPIYDKGGSNERLGGGMYRPLSSFEEKDVLRWTNPGRKHLTGGVSQKAQRAYEHIKASLLKNPTTVSYLVGTNSYSSLERAKKKAQEYADDEGVPITITVEIEHVEGPAGWQRKKVDTEEIVIHPKKGNPSIRRAKEIAARTVRKMIGEGKLNPSFRSSQSLMTTQPTARIYQNSDGTWTAHISKQGLFVAATVHDTKDQAIAWTKKKYRRPRFENPSEAEEISEGFHGRKISEVLEVEEEELIPDNTAVLGCLLDITVTRDNGKTGIPIIFLRDGQKPKRGEEVYVCAPDRHNLEFIGGDQEIKGIEKLCGCDHSKQFVKLGFVESLAYLADKHHLEGSNGREEPYEHEFGKKKWLGFGSKYGRPELIYDTRNCKISLVGGTYTIEDEGITN